MCGICGSVGNLPRQDLESMVAAMRHRGPDDSGVFLGVGFALGMTRLAVLDLSSKGRQPMGNSDGTVWIVYNGETYNFRAERAILEGKGHSFSSNSDTEVVLRMYECYGDDFLLRMRGMFSLAIYDSRDGRGRERLLLARDHFGIKPLLYARAGGCFLFASEMKAMLASGLVERRFDPESLRLLLTFGSIPQPHTAVSGVRMLPPGHRMIVDERGERLERYWSLGTGRSPEAGRMSYPDLVSEVRSALEESVRLQMVSDVPVGAFLSGGVDSSLLVALMAKTSRHRIRTFSVGFGEGEYPLDESDEAERLAEFLGTRHTRVHVGGQQVRERINHFASAIDQPSVDGINSYFVSLAASTGVTVAISGTGGDELFAGYPWFIYMAMAEREEKRHPFRTVGKRLLCPVVGHPILDRLATGRFAGGLDRLRAGTGFFPRYARITRIFGVEGTAKVLSADLREEVELGCEPARDLAASDVLPAAPMVERISAICLRGYTQNQLLRDIDAVSMSHSLEVRVPYLDPCLVDLALSLPRETKLGDITGLSDPLYETYETTGAKRILIDAGRGLLPEGMARQKKRGFGMPFASWLTGPLRDVLEDTLSPVSVSRRGYFDELETRTLVGDFLEGRNIWTRPWLLMITELWCREVLDPGRRPDRSIVCRSSV
jgi:asparagine synthase (glutamine-hydrolysing)